MTVSSIVRSDDLRSENRLRVLNALRSNGPSTPHSLASVTGLSAASISSLSGQLAEQSIVLSSRQKIHGSNVPRGRPQSLIDLNGGAGDVVTLNIAIDLIHVTRANYAGKTLHTTSYDVGTREMDESTLVKLAIDAINMMMELASDQPVHFIGVAFQGVTENFSGTLKWSPIIQQQNVKLGELLRERFDLPVSVSNDCAVISEALSQSHRDHLGDSFATVLFSHGVGLGLYIDGKPFSGISSSALEMGHLRFERNGALCRCGKRGCIEAYAADYGILRMASGNTIDENPLGRIDPSQITQLCTLAQSGDSAAIQAFAIAGAAIGEALATLFALFDPMPVALVGRSKPVVDLMIDGMNSAFRGQRGDTVVISDILHCFDDADPLLTNGLMHNTLARVDRLFAATQKTPL